MTTKISIDNLTDALVTSISSGGGGGGLTVSSITSNTTASSNYAYLISASSALTVTLPASPSIGDRIVLIDAAGNASTNNITIQGNGASITTWPLLIMDQDDTSVEIMYVSSGKWSIVNTYFELSPPVVGEQAYTTTGTYSFVVPSGVASLCAVLVGAGASHPSGGGGGALRYINNLPVTAGETLTVVVGASYLAGGAEDSVLKRGSNTLVYAGGGGLGGGVANYVGGIGSALGEGTYGGTIGGGDGGHTDSDYNREATYLIGTWGGRGGGGAGGYSGNGGHGAGQGKNATAGSGGGGGGGGRGTSATSGGTNPGGGGGGGVGIFGEGASGAAGTNGYSASGGGGGSSGADGTGSAYNNAGDGGLYGGGGGANSPEYNAQYTVAYFGTGAQGAVRLVWGPGRAFPSTNVGQV